MSKKYGFSPFVFLLDVGGDDEVGGGGSGQSGVHPLGPVACSFDFWLKNFAKDYDGDGNYDLVDFAKWWNENSFTMDAWDEYNKGVPFPDLGGDPDPVPGGDEGGDAGSDAVGEAINEMMGGIMG